MYRLATPSHGRGPHARTERPKDLAYTCLYSGFGCIILHRRHWYGNLPCYNHRPGQSHLEPL
jgi:hypothetical protein